MKSPINRSLGWVLQAVPPRVLRGLHQGLYDHFSNAFSSGGMDFLNLGYIDFRPGAEGPELQPEDEPNRLEIQLYQRLIAPVLPLSGREVLEVGCGRGGGSSYVVRYHQPSRMVGVDLSPAAIAHCRSAHGALGIEYLEGDAEALPFPDGTFDVVMNLESSHSYPSFGGFLAEVSRVLRPGGRFVLADLFFRRRNHGEWVDRDYLAVLDRFLAPLDLEIVEAADITANVVASRDLASESGELERAVLDAYEASSSVERGRREWRGFGRWAFYMQGTPMYRALKAGRNQYWCFVLEKRSARG